MTSNIEGILQDYNWDALLNNYTYDGGQLVLKDLDNKVISCVRADGAVGDISASEDLIFLQDLPQDDRISLYTFIIEKEKEFIRLFEEESAKAEKKKEQKAQEELRKRGVIQ